MIGKILGDNLITKDGKDYFLLSRKDLSKIIKSIQTK